MALNGVPHPSIAQPDKTSALHDEAAENIMPTEQYAISAEDESNVGESAAAFDRFSYHIVYSPSYMVPVLFFNAFDAGMILM